MVKLLGSTASAAPASKASSLPGTSSWTTSFPTLPNNCSSRFTPRPSSPWTPLSDPPRGRRPSDNKQGFTLVVKTADCVPILAYNPGSPSWPPFTPDGGGLRGIFPFLPRGSLHRLSAELTESTRFWIGPSICGRCYTVGEELVPLFSEAGFLKASSPETGKGPFSTFTGPSGSHSGSSVSPPPRWRRSPSARWKTPGSSPTGEGREREDSTMGSDSFRENPYSRVPRPSPDLVL